MPDYIVPICKNELIELWHDFWDSGNPKETSKKAMENGSLGQTRIVRARNINEACAKATDENPGYTAIRDAARKVGK